MNEKLEQKLKSLPEAPGIYQMLDKEGHIIYIGKSKCLKKRVHSYFVPSPVWDKAKQMSRFIEDLEIIVTDTHLEAMLLECDRIKTIRPYFNVMMKNDSKYCYLTLEENWRRNPLKVTGTREELSFGPFRSQNPLRDVIETMRNLYPITKNRSRYQFEYHIFPCAMEKDIFEANRKLLVKLLSRKKEMDSFLRAVEREMKQAASEQSFERASKYRDLHTGLTYLSRYLNRYEEWEQSDIVYVVPLADRRGMLRKNAHHSTPDSIPQSISDDTCDIPDNNNYKLFYISNGQIVFSERTATHSPETCQEFIKRAHAHKPTVSVAHTEKALLDYRDIIYAELSKAAERNDNENYYFTCEADESTE